MMRSFVKIFVACVPWRSLPWLATTALAGDLGLVVNGDMETRKPVRPPRDSRRGSPEWLPGWMASQRKTRRGAAPIGGPMSVSPTHSLYIPDDTEPVIVMKCAALRRRSRAWAPGPSP